MNLCFHKWLFLVFSKTLEISLRVPQNDQTKKMTSINVSSEAIYRNTFALEFNTGISSLSTFSARLIFAKF